MRRVAEVNYLVIEARTPEKGPGLAVEVLKRLHREKGTKCPVVKISGSRLSREGVMESSDKLMDKDLIIEEAGDLTVVALTELADLIESSEIRVVMTDNSRQIESMTRMNPSLGSLFTVISLGEDEELDIRRSEPPEESKEENVRVIEEPAEKVPIEIVLEPVAAVAVEEPVVETPVEEEPAVEESVAVPEAEVPEAVEPEAEEESVKSEAAPEEAAVVVTEETGSVPEETTAPMEEAEPASATEENTAAATVELMKLMESVMDDEPSAKKPETEAIQGDNTAAAMVEFMRLMESVVEDPAAAELEKPIVEMETPFTGGEASVPEISMTSAMQTIQPENPMAAAMAAATAVLTAGTPAVPLMTENHIGATIVPTGMTGTPVAPVMMQPVQSIPQSMQQPSRDISSLKSDEEMELHDFVEYTCKYASGIDCSITGKSMLALYERIETMEENGVPLTKINAENLTEEAVDKAEKFSFKKLFIGLFHPRYDKEGLLILREEHFMN